MERVQKTFLKIITVTLATALVAHAQDVDPDFKSEERFHRIYKKYNQEPTSVESWEKVLSGRSANTYSIQTKDTLWDVSHTLFGDSHYWPKVWSYNTDDIQNPHEINPKQVIKFYPGTLAEAPTVGLAEKTDAPEAMPTQILEKNKQGKLEGFKIPPPKRKSRPLVKNLPDSLPLYRLGAVNRSPVDFEVSGARVKYAASIKYLSFYVADAPLDGMGEVVEMEHQDEETSGEYEAIIVRVSNAANKHFVVLKDSSMVSDPFDSLANKARVIEVQGEIEIQERVNEGDNLFRAMVKKSINPLEVGAKLIPGSIAMFDSAPSAISTSVQARIIGGEYERFEQKMFGIDNIVFLNAGAKEGLQLGSTLPVYLNERLRKPNTKAIANDRVIGQVKVIKLADHFATGYVLDSQAQIIIGDYVGGRAKTPENNKSSGNESDFNQDNGGEAPAGAADDFQL
jgi:hypothetical protein